MSAPYWVHSAPDDEPDQPDAPTCPTPKCNRSGEPIWCHGCYTRVAVNLGGLPELAVRLTFEYAERTATPGEKLGKRGKSAAPPSTSADVDAVDELAQWLHNWTIRVAEHLRHHGPKIDTAAALPHLAASITSGSRYLSVHWPKIAEDPTFPVDFGLGVLRIHDKITKWLRMDDPITLLYAPCPRCERVRLRRKNGASQVECGHCGDYWPEDDYRRLVAVILSDTPARAGA